MNGRLRLRLGDLCACPSCPTIARAFRNRFAADVNGPLEHPHVVQRLSVGSTAPEPTSGMAGNGRRVTEVLVRSGSLYRFRPKFQPARSTFKIPVWESIEEFALESIGNSDPSLNTPGRFVIHPVGL